ncbi:hypothetical protein DWX31_15735 [Hungatella hathewayi]|uniref:Uncharacterized protein n=1 Tax=Hungatella hathewayi TaxID=154046 RepID=A0A3E3DJP3_9FIRM|nr:hypothetical protein DWX31_15735 [Hungatella hathewayi]
MYPCAAVEHSYNCMVLLCSLFLWPSGHYTKITFDRVAIMQPFFDDADKSFGFRSYYNISMTAGYAIHFYYSDEKRITLRFLDTDGTWKDSWTGKLQ